MSISITWHGHATFTVAVNGTKIVIDPYFDDNPMATVKAADVAADYILLTHGHGDHVADALPIAQRTGAQIISNFEIVGWINGNGYENAHAQHIGGGFNHPFGHVKMTPAFHGSGLPDGTYGGMPGGFLLTIEGKKLYFAGDTGVFSDMELIARGGIDVAVLPVGDNFTMGPEDSLLALDFLQPAVVIPCHYNTWPPITIDIDAWRARVENETNAKPVVMAVEETYQV
jgi:L-ascorbate metabolism protein UlaG (beta-lactamase superfamily)